MIFKYYNIKDNALDWDSLYKDFKWVRDMENTIQDPIWHAEGNVLIHTKMVIEALLSLDEFNTLSNNDKTILVVSALMHDIEKRSTTTTEVIDGKERIVAPKHAVKGESTARKILYREFDFSFDEREMICKLVRWHGKPLHVTDEATIVKLSTEVSINLLSILAKADILGRFCDDKEDILYRIDYFRLIAEELNCLSSERVFPTKLGEYYYLNGKSNYIDYIPFDTHKFKVILLSGLAGSGKDFWIGSNYKGNIISLDDLRLSMGVKSNDKKGNGQVIQKAKEMAKEYMRKGEDFLWNATNITKQMRKQLIDLFESYGGEVTIVYIEKDYKTLLKQNSNRNYPIPEQALEKMIYKLEPPVKSEAYEIKYIV